jgi:hypothetical protein
MPGSRTGATAPLLPFCSLARSTQQGETTMNNELLKALAKELAVKVNKAVNIPLVSEEDEQAFFELIILMILEIVFSKLGFTHELQK